MEQLTFGERIILGVVPAVVALIGVSVGAFLTYLATLKIQTKVSDRQQRQQVFSRLAGAKVIIRQLHVSRSEARVHSDYY